MSAPTTIEEFIAKFTAIKNMGYIQTHRAGDTGIGKTLEDLLEIKENNIAGPDFSNYELKVTRSSTNSMLSLFTKSPQPKGINATLLKIYGYPSDCHDSNKKVIHATLSIGKMTPCDGTGKFLTVQFNSGRLEIVDNEGSIVAWYEADYLCSAFLKKYRYRLIHCFANTRGKGTSEEFYFHTAIELYNFDFNNFIALLQASRIKVDIRIGQHSNGKPHDHGTGFRIAEHDLSLLFKDKRVLVGND